MESKAFNMVDSVEALEASIARVRAAQKLFATYTQEQVDKITGAITPGLKEDICADCDLIAEAAFEDMTGKQTTFKELDAKNGDIIIVNQKEN